jgi:pimeloyl-ACP methyl ester carboxylesterase
MPDNCVDHHGFWAVRSGDMRLGAKWRAQGMRIQGFEGADVRHVLLPGGRAEAEVVRLGRGEPIVLVPGLAGGWRLLAPLARVLARRHEVIAYGLRGDRAAFAAPAEGGLVDHAHDLAALLDGLRLERPTVFGVSFGGAIALELATREPGRFGGLVLSGAEARFQAGLGATVARRVLERYPLPSDNRFVNQFFNLLHGGKPAPGPLAEFVVERCWETDQGVMARRLRSLEGFDVTDRLWRVDAPTLVLAGSKDVVVTAGRQRALAEAISGARYEMIDGAGHVGFLTPRVEVARHVGRLVRDRCRTLC